MKNTKKTERIEGKEQLRAIRRRLRLRLGAITPTKCVSGNARVVVTLSLSPTVENIPWHDMIIYDWLKNKHNWAIDKE